MYLYFHIEVERMQAGEKKTPLPLVNLWQSLVQWENDQSRWWSDVQRDIRSGDIWWTNINWSTQPLGEHFVVCMWSWWKCSFFCVFWHSTKSIRTCVSPQSFRSNKVTVDDVHIQERNTVLLHFSLNEFERNIFLEQQRNQRLHSWTELRSCTWIIKEATCRLSH